MIPVTIDTFDGLSRSKIYFCSTQYRVLYLFNVYFISSIFIWLIFCFTVACFPLRMFFSSSSIYFVGFCF